jgi:hypothetical protein
LRFFWAIFLKPPVTTEGHKAVGQVEQMVASRCYRASRGALGCTSCHDPHALPPPAERTSYYRGRCLACHAETACAVAPDARRKKSADDSCAACHMPRTGSTISHTAVTDHRIPRRREPPGPPPAAWPRPGRMPLVPFHRTPAGPGDSGGPSPHVVR